MLHNFSAVQRYHLHRKLTCAPAPTTPKVSVFCHANPVIAKVAAAFSLQHYDLEYQSKFLRDQVRTLDDELAHAVAASSSVAAENQTLSTSLAHALTSVAYLEKKSQSDAEKASTEKEALNQSRAQLLESLKEMTTSSIEQAERISQLETKLSASEKYATITLEVAEDIRVQLIKSEQETRQAKQWSELADAVHRDDVEEMKELDWRAEKAEISQELAEAASSQLQNQNSRLELELKETKQKLCRAVIDKDYVLYDLQAKLKAQKRAVNDLRNEVKTLTGSNDDLRAQNHHQEARMRQTSRAQSEDLTKCRETINNLADQVYFFRKVASQNELKEHELRGRISELEQLYAGCLEQINHTQAPAKAYIDDKEDFIISC